MLKKILRLEGKILSFIDSMIDNKEIGYRRMNKRLKEEFGTEISHESLRQYKLYRENLGKSTTTEQNITEYYCCKGKYGFKKGDYKDRIILESLSRNH